MTNITMLCHERFRLTEQALKSLRDHTDPATYNLTLVDDSSTDFRLLRLLERETEKPRTTLLRIIGSDHVVARGKNIGVAWSEQTFGRGDWLYLSDSDVYFKEGWLEKLTDLATTTECRAYRLWGGQIHPFHLQVPPLASEDGRYEFRLDTAGPEFTRWAEHCVLDGPSWLMRWGTWDAIGQLSPRGASGACKGEDGDWCERLRTTGARIGVIHPHVVVHTGLSQSDGNPAPGAAERRAMIPAGVLAE